MQDEVDELRAALLECIQIADDCHDDEHGTPVSGEKMDWIRNIANQKPLRHEVDFDYTDR